MPYPDIKLDIQLDAAGWRGLRGVRPALMRAALATAARLPARLRFPFTATVLLTGNARVKLLNRDFRGIDKPTNVLSFPQFDPAELPKMGKAREPVELGDMALAYQYIVAESKKEHKILINHITHLVIHGLLHLFGYDHVMDDEADKMEKLETTIMRDLGLPDPYLTLPEKAAEGNRPAPIRSRQ
jgi:probable rRNA maturation factor